MKKLIALLAVLCMLLASCTAPQSEIIHEDTVNSQVNSPQALVTLTDKYAAPSEASVISLNGGGASFNGSGGVGINGAQINITAPGVYTIRGTLDNGQIAVETAQSGTVTLVLDNASITNAETSALLINQASETVISLASGSQNIISGNADAQTTQTDAPKAALFSSDDLWICGDGSLAVMNNSGNGIQSKDTLTLASGSFEINAANNAIVGKDSVICEAGKYNITAGNDGVKSTNSSDTTLGFISITGGEFNITAEGDAFSAQTVLEIYAGNFNITTGGGAENAAQHTQNEMFGKGGVRFGGEKPSGTPPAAPGGETLSVKASASTAAEPLAASADTETETADSKKGFKAGAGLNIYGGSFTVNSCDDAFHSNADMKISGGSYTVNTGDDAFHADAGLAVADGDITVMSCYEGIEGSNIEISGGKIDIISSDDAINAAGGDGSGQYGYEKDSFASSGGKLVISGGTIIADAGGDGIDVNGSAEMTGGSVTVYGPENGSNSALDYDGSFTINGGTLAAFGFSQMMQTPSANGAALLSVNANIAAGQTVTIKADGEITAEVISKKTAQNLIYFGDGLKIGSTVTVSAGEAELGQTALIAGTNNIGTAVQGMGGMQGGTKGGGKRGG